MGKALLHPSTLLSMDSSASSTHDDLDLEMSPPDINLPLQERSPHPPLQWNTEHCDILDVGLGSQMYEAETYLNVPKVGRKIAKSIWGAWFFFSFYFKPVLNQKSKAKVIHNSNGVSGFDKSDLQLDSFMVQHDMENMYMWVFKERPENALGKMQLRSYMNGHSRQGDRPFPFSVERGFVRSHRMQRKHYRGLSNPQCVHGVEVVPTPSLVSLGEDDRKRWMELTGRDLNFSIPLESSDYGSWRDLPSTEFELEKPLASSVKATPPHPQLETQLSSHGNNKRKKECFPRGNNNDDAYFVAVNARDKIPALDAHHPCEPRWLNGFSGVLRNAYGPVTAAKTTYEDEEGYLILMSLPFVDVQRVKVSWRNTLTHGIIAHNIHREA